MMRSDIDIARDCQMQPIQAIAKKLNLMDEHYEPIGRYKAKVQASLLGKMADKPDGKLVLVTAITPTPAGEGKTTTTVGLADGLNRQGVKVAAALREPSLGPVFGMKGGAAGGGYAQVVPMEDLNLHFTGDLHAITAANNLLSALIDNHIYQGNALNIDLEKVLWRRCMDMNDRQLRKIECGLGKKNGVPRMGGFDITAASEVMAAFCLAKDLTDLKKRIAAITIALDTEGNAITAGQLNAEGAMTALLQEAFNPNLVQTMEHTPVFVHGGPFANIAHGCNSLVATKLALKLNDVVITEAGFGADLGAEKFMDIKCRLGGLNPEVVVLVATVRALKYHGGVEKTDLKAANPEAVRLGLQNLGKHIENMKDAFKRNVVVAINKFSDDTEEEMNHIYQFCHEYGIEAVLSDVWAKGGKGADDLAKKVMALLDESCPQLSYLYDLDASIEDKIMALCHYYGGSEVTYTDKAKADIERMNQLGFDKLPICVAKTQYSLSDNTKLRARPEGFTMKVRGVQVSSGAGFLVVLTGKILRMPGLPKKPAAMEIDVDEKGRITGLF